MEPASFIAVDFGTQSLRALLVSDGGETLDAVQLASPNFIDSPTEPQRKEYQPSAVISLLESALKQLTSKHHPALSQLRGISITCQRNCLIALDTNARPISNLVHWSDKRRASKLVPMPWYQRLAFAVAGVSERIHLLRQKAIVNVWSEGSDIMQKANKVVQLSAWLQWHLCQTLVDSDASQIGYLPFNFKTGVWYPSYNWRYKALAITSKQLPKLVPPCQRLGCVTAEVAQKTGLPVGLPVYAAGSDKACESFASGGGLAGVANISLGSAATISVEAASYQEAYRYLPAFPSIANNQHIVEIQLEQGLWLLSLLLQQFGLQEQQQAQSLQLSVESLVMQHIDTIPIGCNGLTIKPTEDEQAILAKIYASKSSAQGLTNTQRYQAYRACLEGVLFGLKREFHRVQACSDSKITTLRVSGGGSQSKQLLQMVADLFNLPVETIHTHQACALGAAMCVAVGSGRYRDITQAREQMAHVKQRFLPNRENSARYQKYHQDRRQQHG
ncbi:FGGY family carbohydrate kinase [Paraferrimonas haliotis]|uniref:Carbohydrate kinase n=1 Tax=Paraferrimonas haliotis TaxID=2013866 RepID=A0AA37U1U4_9GAMM|nr:FGGY family carbohydrate kinase [Paraferrimonas haliotis]GLS84731.1 carbohydrate kinase [Paraferrimonas haliotis]